MPPIKRFATLTDDELDEARLKAQNKNTASSDMKWEKVFKVFLSENDMNEDFYAFDVQTLDKWHGKLLFGAHQNNEDHSRYRVKSLKSLRYALNRCLKKSGKTYNIIPSPEFVSSQTIFKDTIAELKSLEFGYVVNHTEITGPGTRFHTYLFALLNHLGSICHISPNISNNTQNLE